MFLFCTGGLGLDINLGVDEEVVDRTIAGVIDEMCASTGEESSWHNRLSVSSMLVSGLSEVSFCSSDYISERSDLADRSRLVFRSHGVDPSELPDSTLVGVFEISISEPSDVSGADYYMRQVCMHDGLRYILNGWARNRDRVVLVSFHSEQHAGVDDERLMVDHVHVLYERHTDDPENFLQSEISEMVDRECSWDTIEQALGMEW